MAKGCRRTKCKVDVLDEGDANRRGELILVELGYLGNYCSGLERNLPRKMPKNYLQRLQGE